MKIFYTILIFCLLFSLAHAEKKGTEQTQRDATGLFDLQFNTKSNISFPVTNYGILFLDYQNNQGAGYWPRGSLNQYLFGGGLWFGAKKWLNIDGTNKLQKLCEINYNPNSGRSWYVPGRIEDGDLMDESDFKKYRVYFSTDMNSEGYPINQNDGPNWPIWSTEENSPKNTGTFIIDIANRNTNTYPMGPALVSDEDIFCTYKGTDLSYFEGGEQQRRNQGYPLGLQFEQTIYSWEDEEYKDMIIILYKAKNFSSDTLWDCWLAPVYDTDLATSPDLAYGAGNDLIRFYDEDESLNLGITWTNMDRNEIDMGYLGVSMILTPAVYKCDRAFDTVISGQHYVYCAMCVGRDTITVPDEQNPGSFKDTVICLDELFFPREQEGFQRTEKKYFPASQQLGLRTFKRWPINDDIVEDEARFNFISSNQRDNGSGLPSDCRMFLASGSFNLNPGQSALCAVQINLAMPALGGDATGETNDLTDLVEKVKLGQSLFYDDIISKVNEQQKRISNSLIIYPNPASNQIYIMHGLIGDIEIKIYDVLGRDVTQKVILNLSKEVLEVNIEKLQIGNYVICLGDGKKVISGNLCVIR